MMNRRQFVYAAAAGAAMFARASNVFAATYDLIIKGGRVIDPSLQARRDPRRGDRRAAASRRSRPTSRATRRKPSMRAASSSSRA